MSRELFYVYSHDPYGEFIQGRDVDNAYHYEDGKPGCIGMLELVRMPGDKVISKAEYEEWVTNIKAYNAALPVVPPPARPVAPASLAADELLAAAEALRTTSPSAAAALSRAADHLREIR